MSQLCRSEQAPAKILSMSHDGSNFGLAPLDLELSKWVRGDLKEKKEMWLFDFPRQFDIKAFGELKSVSMPRKGSFKPAKFTLKGERYIIVEDPHESREVITLFPSSQKTLKPGSRIKRYFSVRQDYLHTERERVPVAIRTVPKVKQLDIKPVTFKPIGYVAPKDFNSESKKKSAKRKSKIHRGSKSASSGSSKKRRKR
uniref:Uncharacterized protein n=1 Tax=Amorphochlora amoebiformis TaxID=1561963 RepID=A0A7S0CYQ0_9EUKA